MTVLLAGGLGFLGRKLTDEITAAGEEAVCVDIRPPDDPALLPPRARFMQADISRLDQLEACFRAAGPRTAINLCYMLTNGPPRLAFEVNALGMDNFFEAARRTETARVLWASSIAVSGGQHHFGDRWVTEADPTYPNKQYDHHKVFNEWQAQDYSQKHGMVIAGIRVGNVSGVDKVIGSTEHVRIITEPALGRAFRYSHADFTRCVIHVDEIATIFARMALAAQHPRHALYNTGGEALSMEQLAGMVRERLPDAKISFEHQTGGLTASGAYLIDNSRLRQEYGLTYRPYGERIDQMIGHARSLI